MAESLEAQRTPNKNWSTNEARRTKMYRPSVNFCNVVYAKLKLWDFCLLNSKPRSRIYGLETRPLPLRESLLHWRETCSASGDDKPATTTTQHDSCRVNRQTSSDARSLLSIQHTVYSVSVNVAVVQQLLILVRRQLNDN